MVRKISVKGFNLFSRSLCKRENKINQIRASLSPWGFDTLLSECYPDFLASALACPYPLEHWIWPRQSWRLTMSCLPSRPDWASQIVATSNNMVTWTTEVFRGVCLFVWLVCGLFVSFFSGKGAWKAPGILSRFCASNLGSSWHSYPA